MTDPTEAHDDRVTDHPRDGSSERRAHTEPVSVRVVTAVAAATDRDPLDLPPLAETIDPDALDDVFATSASNQRLAFDFAGTRVVVEAGEPVRVEPSTID